VDLGIHIPGGKMEKTIYKGQDPKSSVMLVFSGKYDYSRDNNNELDALAEVLTIKLLERLREDESGVYGVGAKASYTKYPENRYSFRISFGCGPENVQKLISSTMEEIAKIKTKGAEELAVQKFKAEEQRSTETELKENGFWTTYLADQYENHEDPAEINTYLKSLDKVTVSALKETALKYLNDADFIQITLYPDKK
jgi:zinc protease